MAREDRGAFVWYDLVTTDVEAAKAFYGETVGWGTQADGDDGVYTMFTLVGQRPFAGVVAKSEAMGDVPPHWIGYVAVDDVDASAAKAVELGGTVLTEPHDLPDVGRWVVIADPQGAALAPFTPTMEMKSVPRETPGNYGWAELNTTDWKAAWRFYSELLGWEETSAMDMGGDLGTYFMFRTASGPADQSMGGMSDAATMMGAPAHWLFYANVDGLDAALERTKRGGGQVLNGPMEVPGDDWVAQCSDPQGGYFAVYSGKR